MLLTEPQSDVGGYPAAAGVGVDHQSEAGAGEGCVSGTYGACVTTVDGVAGAGIGAGVGAAGAAVHAHVVVDVVCMDVGDAYGNAGFWLP